MNHDPKPCGSCARFLAANRKKDEEGPGYCEGYERPAHSTDHPSVLFVERGAWKTRQSEQASTSGQKNTKTKDWRNA